MSNQEQIAIWAKKSFADHVLTCEAKTDKIALYHCGRPGGSNYSFRVVLAPNCIMVYGDIGDRMLFNYRPFSQQISWLRGSVNSGHYMVEKFTTKEKVFCEETARANWESKKENYEEGDKDLDLLTDEAFEDIVSDNTPVRLGMISFMVR
jgi:hypothetical protein